MGQLLPWSHASGATQTEQRQRRPSEQLHDEDVDAAHPDPGAAAPTPRGACKMPMRQDSAAQDLNSHQALRGFHAAKRPRACRPFARTLVS